MSGGGPRLSTVVGRVGVAIDDQPSCVPLDAQGDVSEQSVVAAATEVDAAEFGRRAGGDRGDLHSRAAVCP